MKGLENLVLARRSAPPKGAGAETEEQNPQEASVVPAVDIVNEPPVSEPLSAELGRRSGQNTRMNGSPSVDNGTAELPPARGWAPDMPDGWAPQAAQRGDVPPPQEVAPPRGGYSAPAQSDNMFIEERQTPAPLTQEAMQMMEGQMAQGGVSAHAAPDMAPPPAAQMPAATQPPISQPPAQSGNAKRRSTRLLGFSSVEPTPDVFAAAPASAPAAHAQQETRYPIGWLVVLEGPGLGMSYTLTSGLTTVGRAENQTVSLDFGDDSISREQHVAIAYDEDENRTYVGHGGKRNIVRLNGKPLLTTEELSDGDHLRIGKTTLYFVSLCGGEFSWKAVTEAEQQAAGHEG